MQPRAPRLFLERAAQDGRERVAVAGPLAQQERRLADVTHDGPHAGDAKPGVDVVAQSLHTFVAPQRGYELDGDRLEAERAQQDEGRRLVHGSPRSSNMACGPHACAHTYSRFAGLWGAFPAALRLAPPPAFARLRDLAQGV